MALTAINPANNTSVAGGMAHDLDRLFLRIQSYKAWLDTLQDSDLTTAGYLQADVNVLRSAVLDMDNLRQLYQGLTTQGTTHDFRTFAKQLYIYGSLV